MAKTSVKAAARDAIREDLRARAGKGSAVLPSTGWASGVKTGDSFVNFAQKLGVGADNPLSTATYGFNPITRNRVLLEWVHRGSWLGGVAVDVVADDMTRMGIEYTSELPPEQSERMDHVAERMKVWEATNDTVKWARLYGGCIAVMLIDGQDLRTPFNLETVGPGMFKGLMVLDRWMADPSLEDLVTELGPDLGLPKYYRIGSNAPALRNQVIHHSRLAFRLVGVKLPYQQRLTENLWGLSVLERLWDRMVGYDSASTGLAQLVYKAYLRTLSIEGMREIVAGGGHALNGLVAYTEMMRRFQGIEGITLIDAKDTFEVQTGQAFSGIKDAMGVLAEQLSGALQIPLTRLFGQAPAGLNATGESDMRNYYDHIKQRQEADLHSGLTRVYKCIASDQGIRLPPNFSLGFKSLWQLTDTDKGTIAKSNTETVLSALEQGGIISPQIALKELRQASRTTGVWTNITALDILAADAEVSAPPPEMSIDPETGLPVAGQEGPGGDPGGAPPFGKGKGPEDGPAPQPGSQKEGKEDGDEAGVRPQGKAGAVAQGKAGGGKHRSRLLSVARQVAAIVRGLAPDAPLNPGPLVEALRRYADLITPWAGSVASRMLADVDRRNERAWREQADDLGRDLRHTIRNTPVGGVFRGLMAEQVGLIRSLPLDVAGKVHEAVVEELPRGTRSATLAARMAELEHLPVWKAKLIARTEVSRASVALTQARATAIGSQGYVWRTVGDGDVRPEHRRMNGKFVRWDSPPSFPEEPTLGPYHAGAGPNCRCYPEPVLPEY